ncbi:hypothetical protein [Thalassotalea agarivorans]|uniref:Uncharacterized protein n=1 Tax=Thalassotalea agarivorans TaxID=349064 RepID=A0A1I0BKW9_THASX|nr:hypothetical protein [Thalassotalea agarivorans]SET07232.1 hypothetical protein SAMN05660429_00974 [Thalassotalea agarivorans]
MKYRFLCPQNKIHMSNTPQRAIASWYNNIELGQEYLLQEDYAQALYSIGSAFEISEVLCTCKQIDSDFPVKWLTQSAIILAQCFIHCGDDKQGQAILVFTKQKLEREQRFKNTVRQQIRLLEIANRLSMSEGVH